MRNFFLTATAGLSLFAAPTLAAQEQNDLSPASDWFVDKNLVYQRGSELSNNYLIENGEQAFISEKLPAIYPWMVRIEVQHSFEKDSVSTNHGTGIILSGGKIITAKHVITAHRELGSKFEIKLTSVNGDRHTAEVIRLGETDWAVLQITESEQLEKFAVSPIKLAAPQAGETAIFLGYPAKLGLDAQQNVQSFHRGDAKHGVPTSQLFPMPVVGSVDKNEQLSLSPLAGFPPVGGMSGGPIFNLKGEVIAVQKSIVRTTNDDTGAVMDYEIKGESSQLLDLTPECTCQNQEHAKQAQLSSQ